VESFVGLVAGDNSTGEPIAETESPGRSDGLLGSMEEERREEEVELNSVSHTEVKRDDLSGRVVACDENDGGITRLSPGSSCTE
jgi:hypothetical protein